MHRKNLFLILFAALITPGIAITDEIYCQRGISGQVVNEDVIVADTSCTIESSELKGNVEIRSDGELEIVDSDIHGNIKLSSSGILYISESTLFGNIDCEEGAEVILGCSLRIKGSVVEKCNTFNECN